MYLSITVCVSCISAVACSSTEFKGTFFSSHYTRFQPHRTPYLIKNQILLQQNIVLFPDSYSNPIRVNYSLHYFVGSIHRVKTMRTWQSENANAIIQTQGMILNRFYLEHCCHII